MGKFTIMLKENDESQGTYRINSRTFDILKKYLEPYRSLPPKARKIRCVETGEIFNSAMQALKWLSDFGVEYSYNNANKIKKVCKGKGREEKAFSFHWRYVNESDREIYKTKKQKLERWLYYACLKKRIAGRGCSKQVDLCEQDKQVCEMPFNAGKQAEVHSKSYKLPEEVLRTLQKELEPFCSSIKKAVSQV